MLPLVLTVILTPERSFSPQGFLSAKAPQCTTARPSPRKFVVPKFGRSILCDDEVPDLRPPDYQSGVMKSYYLDECGTAVRSVDQVAVDRRRLLLNLGYRRYFYLPKPYLAVILCLLVTLHAQPRRTPLL
jgi:hypothetical protein